jgi:betaine-aldehyde dehydrogenase
VSLPQQPFIDGKYRAPGAGRPIQLIDPATGEPFAGTNAAGLAEVELAVVGAQRAFDNGWRDLAPGKRAEILFAIAAKLREHAREIASLDMRNIGKPIADAEDEAALGARVFEYYAGAVSKFFGETIPVARGGWNFTLRQPLGVIAAIVPWNFPFPIACWKVAPALAAGNCVVLKPASLSPLSALRLGELAHEAGLPDGVLQVLPGSGGAIGEALVQHPLVRKVSFTGSTEIGARLMALAARGIKRVSLELGGKSPNIVFADSDLDKAARTSPMSVFANAGQDCCARSRVFVERPAFDQFVEKFIDAMQALKVGQPAERETQIGPLVSREQRERVEAYLAAASQREIIGGGRLENPGYFLRPAIILGCKTSDPVWRDEIFGPVVCIRPFDDEAAMLREVNDSPYGLSGSVWTKDLARALRVVRRVESGVLSVNSHSSVHVEAPFGGFKQSGLGRDLGMNALEGYTELKNVFISEE